MGDVMTTGQRIQQARKKAGLSQKQLGGKLGLSASMIGQWENDLRNPKMETLERIADALGVPLSEICSKDLLKNYEILKRRREDHQKTLEALEEYALALRQQEAIKVLGGEYIEKFVVALNDLNMDGRWRVVNHAVDYAHDLAKIPEYQRKQPETTPQPPAEPQESTDTTTPPEGSEGTQKPSEDKK